MSQLEALLNGVKHLEAVDLSRMGGPARLLVRPLGGAEAAQGEGMMFWGMSAEVSLDGAAATAVPAVTDFSRFLEGQKLAWVKAVELGLSHSGETCAPEQAEELPAPWVEALARAIFRISGIQSQGDSFRGAPGADGAGVDGGPGDAAAEPERSAAGGESDGTDALAAEGAAGSAGLPA